jgi:hypothetical protein
METENNTFPLESEAKQLGENNVAAFESTASFLPMEPPL